jgi:hypothetical protein
MTITPGRLVALLTPLVFAPLAGAIAVAAARYLPGVDLDPDRLQEIFIAGALIAFGKAGLWLKGWQDYERRQEPLPDAVAHDLALEAAQLPATAAPEPAARIPEDGVVDEGDGDDAAGVDDELADGPDVDDDELAGLLDEDDELLTPLAGSR